MKSYNYNHYRKLSGNHSNNIHNFQVWLFNILQTGGETASLKNWNNHVTHVEVDYEDAFCEIHFALWEKELLWAYKEKEDDNGLELFIEKSLDNSHIN